MKSGEANLEISKLLASDKDQDQVEKEAQEILSKQLHMVALEEIYHDLENSNPDANLLDYEPSKLVKLSREQIQENMKIFQERIKQLLQESSEEKEIDLSFIKIIFEKFPEAKVCLVGGAVRDGLSGLENDDYDFIIQGVSEDKLEKLLLEIGDIFVTDNKKKYGTFKFKPKNSKTVIDLALPRKEQSTGGGGRFDFEVYYDHNLPVEDDLSRRDIAINAMALDMKDNSIIDLTQGGIENIGMHDLEHGIIRTVGSSTERISEDYSRMMRIIRFACKTGFKIDEETWEAICNNAENILVKDDKGKQKVAGEIIGKELNKAFAADPIRTLELLDKSKLLKQVLPEIENLKGSEQRKDFHQEGDVYAHTKLVLKNIPSGSPLSLIYGALFHDVGKPDTQTMHENGKITNYEHEKKSAEIISQIGKRLRWENDFKQKVHDLVLHHMRVFSVDKMNLATVRRLLFSEYGPELLRLHKADILSSVNNNSVDENRKSYTESINLIKKIQAAEKREKQKIEIVVNGKDIMNIGFKAGPIIRYIKELIESKQIEGKISSKEQALEYLEDNKDQIINDYEELLENVNL